MKKQRRTTADTPVDEYRRSIADERHFWIHHRTWAIASLFCDLRNGPVNKRRFKSDIENVLTGPFHEWIRRTVMAKHRVSPDEFLQDAWNQSKDEVEFEFVARFLQPIDGTFDRTKAALEALKTLRKDEPHNHQETIRFLKEKHQTVASVAPLPRDEVEEFFRWVEEVMRVAIFNQECVEVSKSRYERRYGRKRAKGSTRSNRTKTQSC